MAVFLFLSVAIQSTKVISEFLKIFILKNEFTLTLMMTVHGLKVLSRKRFVMFKFFLQIYFLKRKP